MRASSTLVTAVVAASGLLLAGCGSSGHNAAAAATATGAAVAAPAATTSATASATTGSQPAADDVVAKFKAAKLPIGTTITYTAADDPNHLLGRPNGYLSKTSFTDTRINPDQADDSSQGSVDLGGSVEVYPNAAGAEARMDYIQSELKANPMLGTEYDYVVGAALVRVSSVLTPSQAQAYQTAAQ
jgi:hypothetical protein